MNDLAHARASFTRMEDSTQEDWQLIVPEAMKMAKALPDRILDHLRLLDGDFGGFPVDRLTHSRQTATLALKDGRVSSSMRTDFVLDALEQALYARQPERDGSLVCRSDRGSQYVSIRYTERLGEAGIEPSVGSKGDSYDNALAETINGLYKAELIHRRAPWKTKEAVEFAMLEWVSWFNHHRLLEPIGYIPPAEAEANYYRQLASQNTEAVA